MRIALLNNSSQVVGGGFSFLRNLSKGLQARGHQVVDDCLSADIAVVSGVTMVTWDTIEKIKEKGIKLVVRLDNVPRNSRNRNSGTSRLKGFCNLADEVVWQCRWAKDYLIDFIGKEGTIIYNGVDTDLFKPEGNAWRPPALKDCNPIYLYSRFNRDETKNWEVAWYEYQLISRDNPNAGLVIVGKFSPEQEEYNFDFFRNEKFVCLNTIEDSRAMADIYRGSDYLMAPYYNDCFSNTYLEFLATKNENKLYKPNMSGGTPELIDLWEKRGREYFTLDRMAEDYEKVFEKLLQ